MITLQAVALGAMLALTPSVLMLVYALWFDGKLPSEYPPEILFEDRLAFDLRDCAARINDPLVSPEAVAARVRLIMACRIPLQATGFQVELHRDDQFIEDDGRGK
jgi:hypothetical protein